MAFDYLIANSGLSQKREDRTWTLRWGGSVDEEFPTSHYTYAVLARQTSVYAKKKAIDLQPNNELNPWLWADIARQVMEAQSTCAKELPKEIPLDLDNLELPDGVADYLDQHEWWVRNRYCRKTADVRSHADERP
jgi:hypothetical protein